MYRVLIADDEPIERQVVGKKIRRYFSDRFEIIEAVNGREAVALFEEKHCQIAVLDIEMPGMNGLEAAELIRKKDKECSIIFLTAFDEFSYAKRAISVRALDYLLKPGTDEELIATLEEALYLAEQADLEKKERRTKRHETDRKSMRDGNAKERVCSDGGQGELDKLPENIRIKAVAETISVYIEQHYSEDISLQDIAAEMNYSDAYFCKLFKQCFQKSFIVYLSELRVEKAKELLADIAVSVRDVSAKVGYRDSNYFAKVFKRVTGVTPSEYRLKAQNKV